MDVRDLSGGVQHSYNETILYAKDRARANAFEPGIQGWRRRSTDDTRGVKTVARDRLIPAKLGRVRRLLRVGIVAAGAGRMAVFLSAGAALSFVLDRTLRLPGGARAVALTGFGAFAAWQAFTRLIAPALRSMPDEAIALELEERRPGLCDLLGSAAFFLQAGPSGSLALDLQQAAIRRASTAAAQIDARALVDWRPVRRWVALGALSALSVGAAAVVHPHAARLWFARNVMLSSREWPRVTQLSLLDAPPGVLHVARGVDVPIRVRASGVIPRTAELHVRGAAGRRTLPMERTGDDLFVAELPQVSESVDVSVRAGDGRLGPYRIEAVDRPAVAQARMIVRPPGYISTQPSELAWRSARFDVPKGSTVTVALAATKPLSDARWRQGDAPFRPMARPERQSAECSFDVSDDMRCTFTLTDETGIEGESPLEADISAVRDRAPEVTLQAPCVGAMVLPTARVPIIVSVADDYGVAAVWLERRFGKVDWPLVMLRDGGATVDVTASRVLDLAEMDLPPRGRLVLRAGARDLCTIDGPNTGRSSPLVLRLVSMEELLRALVLTQQDLRRDLEAQIRREEDLRAEVAATGPSEQSARVRASIAGVLRKTAAGYADVLAQMLNNGVILAPTHDARRAGIVEPLVRLGTAAKLSREGALADMRQVRERMLLLEDYAALLASVNEISRAQGELRRRTDDARKVLLDRLLSDQ